MKKTLRTLTDKHFIFILTALLILFFWDMIFGGTGYLYGDYRDQFYPWTGYLSTHLKHFSLPVWAPEIGCGFPFLAEGQAACFYPLNVIFFLLPFPFSYHASFIIYFFLAGLFMFFFAKDIGLSFQGAALCALLYLFGSNYAGIFYGYMTLRVGVFIPLCFLFVCRLGRKPSLSNASSFAMSLGAALLGGYPQLAFYGLISCYLFFAYFISQADPRKTLKHHAWFFVSAALGVAVAAAQLLPSWELAQFSARTASGLEFALQKSFNPINIITLGWPAFSRFLGFDFYMGVVPLLLIYMALKTRNNQYKLTKFLLFHTFVFIFLSLGRYNPFYVMTLKLFRFYIFRVPSKLIFFASISMALLAGSGLDILLKSSLEKREVFFNYCKKLAIGLMTLFFITHIAVRRFKAPMIQWAEDHIRHRVYAVEGHPHSLESYLSRVSDFYRGILENTSFASAYCRFTLCLIGALFLIFFLSRVLKKISSEKFVFFLIGICCLDLFAYSFWGTGFRGNRVSRSSLESSELSSQILKKDLNDRFRICSIQDAATGERPFLRPNLNMKYGVSDIGIYSPLALNQYQRYVNDLGVVDNSTQPNGISKESIESHLKLLEFLNVRYIISALDLKEVHGLKPVGAHSSGSDYLYEDTEYKPRMFWADSAMLDKPSLSAEIAPSNLAFDTENLQEISRDHNQITIRTNKEKDGFLFISEVIYPGWTVTIDMVKADAYRVNGVFRGVLVPAGTHEVRWTFIPASVRVGSLMSFAALLICFFCLLRKRDE